MGKKAHYKVKMGSNATGIRTYRVMKRGKVRFRIKVKTLSQTDGLKKKELKDMQDPKEFKKAYRRLMKEIILGSVQAPSAFGRLEGL